MSFAAWKGFDSPLRSSGVTASCSWGGHDMWWDVEASDLTAALTMLPRYVADRAMAIRIEERELP